MTAPAPPAGPPCDLCGEELPVMSVMNLADYSTVQIGPGCLPTFLAGLQASLRGPETPAEAPAPADMPVPAPDKGGPLPAAGKPPAAKPRAAHPRGPRRGG